MKLLKLAVSGLPLFSSKLEIDFAAVQRVSSKNAKNMCHVFGRMYQNNAIAIVGINASGKTSLLKVLTFAMGLLRSDTPINNLSCREILEGISGDHTVVFESYFFSAQKQIHYLKTVIRKNKNRYFIAEEELKSKNTKKSMTKKDVFDFSGVQPDIVRNANEAYLLDDISIMVAFNRRSNASIDYVDMLQHTDVNQLEILEDVPSELIAFFDPCIEYLRIQDDPHIQDKKKGLDIRLKFHGKDEITIHNISDLNHYLSSGTIKGINTFVLAMRTFKTGGYLIIDEIENHFNREIVSTLIRFYRDHRVNPRGATLVFTTHYAELLDEFERNDNIYIVRNRNGITAQNMSDILNRNDIKKSEAYESGFLEGTVPIYESYMALKHLLAQRMEG